MRKVRFITYADRKVVSAFPPRWRCSLSLKASPSKQNPTAWHNIYQQTLLQRMASYWILLVDGAGTGNWVPNHWSCPQDVVQLCAASGLHKSFLPSGWMMSFHVISTNWTVRVTQKTHHFKAKQNKKNIVLGENNSKIGRNITFPKKFRPPLSPPDAGVSRAPGAPQIPPGKLHCEKVLEDGRWAHELDLQGRFFNHLESHKAEVFSRNKLRAWNLKVNLHIEWFIYVYIYKYRYINSWCTIYIYINHINTWFLIVLLDIQFWPFMFFSVRLLKSLNLEPLSLSTLPCNLEAKSPKAQVNIIRQFCQNQYRRHGAAPISFANANM